MVRLFLVDHYYRLGRWLLWPRLHQQFRKDLRYLEHPMCHLVLWVLVHRSHLLFPKGQQFLVGRMNPMVPLPLLHPKHRQFPMAPLYLEDHLDHLALSLLLPRLLRGFRWHLLFHLGQQYLEHRLSRSVLSGLARHLDRRFRMGHQFLVDLMNPMDRWLLWHRTLRPCRTVRLFLEHRLFHLDR